MANLDDIFEYFEIDDKNTNVTTLNGWVMENTDKIPEIGDSFDYKDLHFEVVETDGRRAEKVKVTKTVTEIEEQNEE